MSAPKYKEKPPKTSQGRTSEKEEVEEISGKINNLMKDPDKFKKAMKINHDIYELNSALFLETSPAPVKYALSLMGKCNSKLRLPLVDVNKSTKEKIKRVLSSLNII